MSSTSEPVGPRRQPGQGGTAEPASFRGEPAHRPERPGQGVAARRRAVRGLAWTLALAAAYFALARLGLTAAAAHHVVSSIWPAAGLALAALLLRGAGLWPGVWLGAFALNASSGVPVPASLALATGNTLGPLLGAWALRRFGFRASLGRLRDVAGLIAFGAVGGSLVTSAVGMSSLVTLGDARASEWWRIWAAYFTGDAVGVLLLTPLLLTWADHPAPRMQASRAEGAALFAALLALSTVLFLSKWQYVYAVFPIVGWITLRLGQRGTTAATGVVSVLAALQTIRGLGPFAQADPLVNLSLMQLFLALLATTSLVFGAALAEARTAEHSLRLGETQLRQAQALTGLGSWEYEPASGAVRWSREMLEIRGVADAPLEGTLEDHLSRLHPDDRERSRDSVREALARGGRFRVEERIVRPSGEVRWLESVGQVVRDPDGGVRVFGASLDVTERRRTEHTLELARNELVALLDASPLGILQVDREGLVLRWSRGAERLFGWDELSVLGRVCPTVPPELLADYREMIARAFSGVESRGMIRDRRRRDGTLLRASISCAAVRNPAGEVAGAITVLEDITVRTQVLEALRQSQRELQGVIAHAPVGIFRKTPEGRILMANQTLVRMLGYECEADLLSLDVGRDVYYRSEAREKRIGMLLLGGDVSSGEVEFRRRDGSPIWVQWDARAVRGEQGEVLYLETFVSDVSARHRAAEELRESRDRHEELARRILTAQESERRAVARGLHDEIGQVLTSVRMAVEALGDAAPDEARAAALAECLETIDFAMSSVREMSLDLRPSVLDDLGLAAALRTYTDRVARRAGLRAIVRTRLGNRRLPPGIETVCFRIAQEALTNVARHARARNVMVDLRWSEGGAELEIADDGVGFDPLAARGRGGMGQLGMAERAQLVYGRVTIESQPLQGTRVVAWLPIPKARRSRRGPALSGSRA